MKIGIPRALLYYRYHVLWNTFFQELGIETVIVEPGFLLCNVCFLCSLPCLIRFLVGFSCF